MKPQPSWRLRFLAGTSVLATALMLLFSGASAASAQTAPSPGMFGPVMRMVQSLSTEFTTLEATVEGFADSFTTKELTFNRATGDELDVQTLCIGSTCIDEAQLQALLANASASGDPSGAIDDTVSADDLAADATDTPPVIALNGDNPAIVQVGATYQDLGATITGPQLDLNLDIATYVNGSPMDPVLIDTSAAATDTIDYVVTDQNGLAATSTRTVIIEAVSDNPAPATTTPTSDNASSTDATSTGS